jgi:hypothetical protein
MTFHRYRHRRLARGTAPRNALGHHLSPRLAVSLTAVEHIRVVALADRLGIPAWPSQPTSPSSSRSIPNLMEDAMTSSTSSKKSNGLQGDLLSGEWRSESPRRGSGQHIRLNSPDGERVAVPGMADFSGEGPAGTYCRDCNHFAEEIAVQTGINAIERTRSGCVIWAQKMAHAAPSARCDIRLCLSCKHFEEAADASPRCFIIDRAGMSYRLDSMPEDLRAWLRQKQKR